jgi:hypothetical protein
MGFPPPTDLPKPLPQVGGTIGLKAGFQGVPVGALPCGLSIPGFAYGLSFRIPKFPPWPFPPTLAFWFSLRCSLTDPFGGGIKVGGGRMSNCDPDVDEEFG